MNAEAGERARVADAVGKANLSRSDLHAGLAQRGDGVTGERVNLVLHLQERRGVMTADTDGTKTTLEAHKGVATPEVRVALGAVVRTQAVLETSDGLQAATEVFDRVEVQARTAGTAAVLDALVGRARALAEAEVNEATDGDRRLGRCGTRERDQRGESDQRFFHCRPAR
jgi:hypothetical protein